jgi:hypothetical protein
MEPLGLDWVTFAILRFVKGRDFAQFRHGMNVVNWPRFAARAESQGYAKTVSPPQPRSPLSTGISSFDSKSLER